MASSVREEWWSALDTGQIEQVIEKNILPATTDNTGTMGDFISAVTVRRRYGATLRRRI